MTTAKFQQFFALSFFDEAYGSTLTSTDTVTIQVKCTVYGRNIPFIQETDGLNLKRHVTIDAVTSNTSSDIKLCPLQAPARVDRVGKAFK